MKLKRKTVEVTLPAAEYLKLRAIARAAETRVETVAKVIIGLELARRGKLDG